jgi:hypothetical protein
VLPKVDVAPPEPLPPVRTEVPARSGIGIGPGLGIGPTMVLPKVDLRPSNPGTPLSSLPPALRGAPRLADLEPEAAPGDVLPEGAATIQMGAWSPPEEPGPSPPTPVAPSSSDAAPTRMVPIAAVAPATGDAAPTVVMGAVDIDPRQR